MTDKLQTRSDSLFPLPDVALMTLSGRDCIAFAQSQFMSDVAALADGHWHWSGWLTPKGRLIALFALLRRDAERLDLAVFDADPAPLAEALRRYVFRSNVVIDVPVDLRACGRFGAPVSARGAALAADDAGIELDLGTPDAPRTLRFGSRTAPSDTGGDTDAVAHWRAIDVAHGLPRLGADQREQWTPQQLSLERLQAFSVAKGCYPGQEIVARTHFLGQAKRGLVALDGASPLAPGHEVHAAGQVLGRIVSTAGTRGLAVMTLDRPATPWTVGGERVTEIPLRDGLAR